MLTPFIDTMAYLEYGILVAVVITVIVLVIIRSMNDRKAFNALSYIIAAVLTAILSFQMSRLIGAYMLNDGATTIGKFVGMFDQTASQLIHYSTKDVGWFIFRRILWSVIFIAVCGFGIYITMDKKKKKHFGYDDTYDGGGYVEKSDGNSKYDYDY